VGVIRPLVVPTLAVADDYVALLSWNIPLCLPESVPARLDSGWYRLQNVAAKDQYARSLH